MNYRIADRAKVLSPSLTLAIDSKAKAMKAEGVSHLFTLCGGHIQHIYDGCLDEGIRVVDFRHEQAAGHAADIGRAVGQDRDAFGMKAIARQLDGERGVGPGRVGECGRAQQKGRADKHAGDGSAADALASVTGNAKIGAVMDAVDTVTGLMNVDGYGDNTVFVAGTGNVVMVGSGDDTIARLRDLWAEGLSTAEIGRRLGVSKNAIVGKAHRLELSARPSPSTSSRILIRSRGFSPGRAPSGYSYNSTTHSRPRSSQVMATGFTTSGSLGILIPPSIVMIIYAVSTSTSAGRLFFAELRNEAA